MNWMDYRDQLGIGLSDDSIFKFLKTNVISFIEHDEYVGSFLQRIIYNFCQMTGTPYIGNASKNDTKMTVIRSIEKNCRNLKELIALFVALINAVPFNEKKERSFLFEYLQHQLEMTNIKYELVRDNEDVFIFPLGAKELDKSLVSEPLNWLKEFNNAYTIFSIALKQYSNQEFVRDTADNLRKALEEFLHQFFSNQKNLASNIVEVGKYIKELGGSEEIVSIFKGLLNAYDALNNKCVKHNDKIDPMFLEFLLYQTGLFIRMLIVARKTTGK